MAYDNLILIRIKIIIKRINQYYEKIIIIYYLINFYLSNEKGKGYVKQSIGFEWPYKKQI